MVKGIEQTDDVLMVHVLQQSEFSEGALRVGGRLKGTVEFFYRHLCICDGVHSRTKMCKEKREIITKLLRVPAKFQHSNSLTLTKLIRMPRCQ